MASETRGRGQLLREQHAKSHSKPTRKRTLESLLRLARKKATLLREFNPGESPREKGDEYAWPYKYIELLREVESLLRETVKAAKNDKTPIRSMRAALALAKAAEVARHMSDIDLEIDRRLSGYRKFNLKQQGLAFQTEDRLNLMLDEFLILANY